MVSSLSPHCGQKEDTIAFPCRTEPGENVRRAGEDIPLNAVVLRTGIRLGPAELGVAASVGRAELRCAQRPKVAVLVTGDELTEPGTALGPGAIYSSNAYALGAQVERAGGEVVQADHRSGRCRGHEAGARGGARRPTS